MKPLPPDPHLVAFLSTLDLAAFDLNNPATWRKADGSCLVWREYALGRLCTPADVEAAIHLSCPRLVAERSELEARRERLVEQMDLFLERHRRHQPVVDEMRLVLAVREAEIAERRSSLAQAKAIWKRWRRKLGGTREETFALIPSGKRAEMIRLEEFARTGRLPDDEGGLQR